MNALQSNVRLSLYLLGGSIVPISATCRLILPDQVNEWPATHFSTALAVTSLIIAQLDKACSIYWLLGTLGVVALAMVWPSADPLHKMSNLTATSQCC